MLAPARLPSKQSTTANEQRLPLLASTDGWRIRRSIRMEWYTNGADDAEAFATMS